MPDNRRMRRACRAGRRARYGWLWAHQAARSLPHAATALQSVADTLQAGACALARALGGPLQRLADALRERAGEGR